MKLRISGLFRAALVLLPALWTLDSTPAAACFLPPAARVRTTYPDQGDANVPTSVRPRVEYRQGPYAQTLCGAAPPAPVLRLSCADADAGAPDGGDSDGGAACPEVAGTWSKATDIDPRDGTIWVFKPAAPLAPNTAYELWDGYPKECACSQASPCPAQAAAVFARFMTGAGPDTTPPTYGGLLGNLCTHDVCGAADITCCGPYDHLAMRFVDAADASDQFLVGTHLYVRKDGDSYDFSHPVSPFVIADPVDTPFASRWDITLTPGTWHAIARAFDSSGNEDTNMNEFTFQWPLASNANCQNLFYDAGAMPDLALNFDMTLPPDSAMATDDMGSTLSGGGCELGGPSGGGAAAGLGVIAMFAVVALVLRRRR